MNNKSNFYYDAVKGIYLNDNIVKFNLVSVPMSQNDIEEKITLISSMTRFESMVNFLSEELKKMKSIETSKNETTSYEKKNSNKKVPIKGKILASLEKK
ncbi:hypothetical protein IDH08_05550 [Pelagibacterales bacterium SAG-MED22]|nr:hypothetical protein [Pelagibacterales bacterium SAG-MED22]